MEILEVFGKMSPGMAVLAGIGILVAVIVGLFMSGMIGVKIEFVDEDGEEIPPEKIKELKGKTLKHRLAKKYIERREKRQERLDMAQSDDDKSEKSESGGETDSD